MNETDLENVIYRWARETEKRCLDFGNMALLSAGKKSQESLENIAVAMKALAKQSHKTLV